MNSQLAGRPGSPSTAAPLLASVLDQIGQQIISSELSEGHTFTLQDISERFDISRTVARETMRALEQMGLVTSSRRVGITVSDRSSWAVFDPQVIGWRLASEKERPTQLRSLTELRIAVEPIAAAAAAHNATDQQRSEFLTLARELRQLGDAGEGSSQAFLEVDIRFHRLLLEASGNEMFVALAKPMAMALEGRTHFGLQPQHPEGLALEAHENLADCILERDTEGAEAAARKLLGEVRTALDSSRDAAP